MLITRRTHLTHVFGDDDPMREVNVQDQEQRYASLRQGEKEYISAFKLRFDNQLKAMEGAGIPTATESKKALEFILKLDAKRYGKMLAQMRNDALRSVAGAYPPTLAAAFRIASGWSNPDLRETNSAVTKHSGADSNAGTAFVTKASQPITATAKSPKNPKRSASSIKCFVCGETGHYARECDKRAESTKETALVAKEDQDDDQSENWKAVYLTGNAKTVLFTDYDILLDNEASISIFRNKSLLSKIQNASEPITLKGVQRAAPGIRVSREGTFRELGQVYFSEKSSANILSFATLVDEGAVVRYNTANDSFDLISAPGRAPYTFTRRIVNGHKKKFYCCDARTLPEYDHNYALHAFLRKTINAREMSKAREARQLLARLGFPPTIAAAQIVETGSNFRVTRRDFQNADAIWGPDVASLKGKSTLTASIAPVPTLNVDHQREPQTLSIDIMFVDRIPILVGVAYPLDLTMAADLKMDNNPSRNASALQQGILSFTATLLSQGYPTALIMSDGEKAVGKLRAQLNQLGIEVDISGAGGHVARVERRIRTVKERIRSYVSHHLPFAASTLILTMCALFCVSRLNFQNTAARPNGPSPRQAFTGRPADAAIDFRVGFGDYLLATVPVTSNNLTARTEDCIAVLPTGNRSGSVKMLSLATGRIVTRNTFKVLPIPQSAILRLNQLATLDGRGHNETARMASRYLSDHHGIKDNTPIGFVNDSSGTRGEDNDAPAQDSEHQDDPQSDGASVNDAVPEPRVSDAELRGSDTIQDEETGDTTVEPSSVDWSDETVNQPHTQQGEYPQEQHESVTPAASLEPSAVSLEAPHFPSHLQSEGDGNRGETLSRYPYKESVF